MEERIAYIGIPLEVFAVLMICSLNQRTPPPPRFLDGRTIRLPSVPVSLCCLSLARTYRLPYFLTHTANYLLASLTPHTVLAVLQAVLPHSSYSPGARAGQDKDRQGPSAPTLWHLENSYQGVEDWDNQVTGKDYWANVLIEF